MTDVASKLPSPEAVLSPACGRLFLSHALEMLPGTHSLRKISLRYMGKGVTKAVENVNKIIGPALAVRIHP